MSYESISILDQLLESITENCDTEAEPDKKENCDTEAEPDKKKNCMMCAICLEDVEDSNDDPLFTPCIHGFHSSCIMTWIQKNNKKIHIPCPICKTDISMLAGYKNSNILYRPDYLSANDLMFIEKIRHIFPNMEEKSIYFTFKHLRDTNEIENRNEIIIIPYCTMYVSRHYHIPDVRFYSE
jgi:hypothetical protein